MPTRGYSPPRTCPVTVHGHTASGRPATVDCGRTVGRKQLMCRDHWYALPAGLRTAVLRAYGRWQRLLDDPSWEVYKAARQDALDTLAPTQETDHA